MSHEAGLGAVGGFLLLSLASLVGSVHARQFPGVMMVRVLGRTHAGRCEGRTRVNADHAFQQTA